MAWYQQRAYLECLKEDKYEQQYQAWEQGGRKGPPPQLESDDSGPLEFGSLPDIMEIARQ